MPRLEEIHTNLIDRLQEARDQGWLGEVAAIETTLAAATQKLEAMRDLTTKHTTVHLGMPDFRTTAGRSGCWSRSSSRTNSAVISISVWVMRSNGSRAAARRRYASHRHGTFQIGSSGTSAAHDTPGSVGPPNFCTTTLRGE
ncbi:hypothetical protein ABZ769_20690 [Streptomyces olivoreticuli]